MSVGIYVINDCCVLTHTHTHTHTLCAASMLYKGKARRSRLPDFVTIGTCKVHQEIFLVLVSVRG